MVLKFYNIGFAALHFSDDFETKSSSITVSKGATRMATKLEEYEKLSHSDEKYPRASCLIDAVQPSYWMHCRIAD